LNGLTARAARHRDGKRDTCAIKLRFGVTNRSLSRWVAVLQLAADQSEYAASILSRRARLLPGLMWDLGNTPLPDREAPPLARDCRNVRACPALRCPGSLIRPTPGGHFHENWYASSILSRRAEAPGLM
jgi:hypothetical protein